MTGNHAFASQKTLLLYGHYDVQPASLSDGWNTEPFKLTEQPDPANQPEGNVRLCGRGASDDKGPVLGWINALQAIKETGGEFPVGPAALRSEANC